MTCNGFTTETREPCPLPTVPGSVSCRPVQLDIDGDLVANVEMNVPFISHMCDAATGVPIDLCELKRADQGPGIVPEIISWRPSGGAWQPGAPPNGWRRCDDPALCAPAHYQATAADPVSILGQDVHAFTVSNSTCCPVTISTSTGDEILVPAGHHADYEFDCTISIETVTVGDPEDSAVECDSADILLTGTRRS